MNRIDNKFNELRAARRKAFIAYVTAGDPDLAVTRKVVLKFEEAGVDIVELGIPFSDPIADGPTIQAASYRALKGKATLKKIFAMVRSLRAATDMPLVFMTYYNPVLRYGLKKFFASCRKCGVDGVIVPDLPCEEASDLIKFARFEKVATIFLSSPTSTPERIRDIAKNSKGFIYYVSLTGVTGARRELPKDISSKIRAIRSFTDKPVAVGFGVSSPNQAARIARVADGVIVGSAIVKIMGENKNITPRVYNFAKSIAKAVHVA
ncbi:MAG: tryptophan synthase subunit alpha [Candidatus Omnitrophica bacterium]|nr:tryptophan synthase subunit alpha [Candidatus Omnitrophota bacterium]